MPVDLTSPIWHPFTQHAVAGPAIWIDRAEGARLYTRDGRILIDAISSWWVTLHGHAHPKIAAAITDQAARLEQVIFAGFTHEPAECLAAEILERAPRGLAHVFFSDSGSTAVEVAVKMAVGCWRHRGEQRTRLVALEGGYHGDTFGAMSCGERGLFTEPYWPMLFRVDHLPFPAVGRERETLDAFDRLLDGHAGRDIAALILEPLVLGAGGMRMYSPSVLRTLAERARQAGIFLIADEVMTGFGRTGTFFACDHADVSPDILCLSKGLTGGFLPMGLTLATPQIFDAFYATDRARMFFHSTSYTGNPIACAAARASLAIWAEEPVQERIDRIALHHRRRLNDLVGHPAIADIRQAGTIAAIEVKDQEAGYLASLGPRLYSFFLHRGVLLRPLGNVIYSLPPYCITEQELDTVHDAIVDALAWINP